MKPSKLAAISLAVLTTLGASAVFGADPPSRADVRKEAISARKSVAHPEAGAPAPTAMSTKARSEVKGEQATFSKSGGYAMQAEAGPPVAASKSIRAKGEVRAEARQRRTQISDNE